MLLVFQHGMFSYIANHMPMFHTKVREHFSIMAEIETELETLGTFSRIIRCKVFLGWLGKTWLLMTVTMVVSSLASKA